MRRSTMLMSQWKADTQTGENLQFEYCSGGYFSDREEYGLKVVGATAQETLTGKNLVGRNVGAASNGTYYGLSLDSSQTYTLTIKLKSGQEIPDGGYIGIAHKQSSDSSWAARWAIQNGVQKNETVTRSASSAYSVFFAVYPNSQTMWEAFFDAYDIQLELGSTPSPYEPYCGGIPAPNPDYPMDIQCVKTGTEVRVRGKNLLDANQLEIGGLSGNMGLEFTATNRIRIVQYIPVEAGKVYTLSGITSGLIFANAHVYNSDKSRLASWENSATIIDNGAFIRFSLKKSGESDFTDDELATLQSTLMLEPGSEPSPYEPFYDGGTVTLPCDLYEGDIFWPMTGVVERHTCVAVFTRDFIDTGRIIYNNGYYWMNFFLISSTVNTARNCAYGTHGVKNGPNDYGYGALYWGGLSAFFGVDTSDEALEILYAEADKGNPVTFVFLSDESLWYEEQYDPQPIHAPQGTVNVLQTPAELSATLSATMLKRR